MLVAVGFEGELPIEGMAANHSCGG
jgi:hypothetical protein